MEGFTSPSSDALPALASASSSIPHRGLGAPPLPGDDVPPNEGQASVRLEQHEELTGRPRVMKKEKEREKALKEEAPDQLLRIIAEYVSLTSHYDIYLTMALKLSSCDAEQLMFIAQPVESGSYIPIVGPSSGGSGLPFEQSYFGSILTTNGIGQSWDREIA